MKNLALITFIITMMGLSSLTVQADMGSTSESEKNTIIESHSKHVSWLGVQIQNIPLSLARHLSSLLKQNQGILVNKVSVNSPAAKSGLQMYDIIIKFNNQEIYSPQQLSQLIQNSEAETKVQLTLVRQGKLINKEVILKSSPNQSLSMQQQHPQPLSPMESWAKMNIPNWVNDSFFNSQFNDRFNNRFNHWNGYNYGSQPMDQTLNNLSDQQHNWTQFESINVKSIGADQFHANVKYKDKNGHQKEFIFEGKIEAIREQILAQNEMDEEKKQKLLQVLNMQHTYQSPFGQNRLMVPNW